MASADVTFPDIPNYRLTTQLFVSASPFVGLGTVQYAQSVTVQPADLHRCRSNKLYAIIWSMLINGNMQVSKLMGLSRNNSQHKCRKIDRTVRYAY